MKDIVIDATAIRLFGVTKDIEFIKFFSWLQNDGVLTVSSYLIKDYSGCGSHYIAALLSHLINNGRLNKIATNTIKFFNDRHYRYRSNDRLHVRLVMLSDRRLALSHDDNFIHDINNFPGMRATAARRPSQLPYQ